MTTGPHDDDLLDGLAGLLAPRTEPPPEVLYAAREVFTWRTVDAEIAALAYDSLLDDAATTRATAPPRLLSFETADRTIELELDTGPSGRRLLGQLDPAGEAELELRAGGEVLAAARSDALGRFVLPLPEQAARVSVRCRPDGGPAVESAPTVV